MEATPPLVVTSVPVVELNQPAPMAQINQSHSYSHTEDMKRLPHYNSKAAVATGTIQISCGVLAIILETIFLASVGFFYPVDKASVGVWSGAMFSVTGAIGIFSSKKKRGMVIVYVVLSIMSSVTALVGFCFALGRIQSFKLSHDGHGITTLVVSLLSLIVNVVEGFTAITASSFACAAGLCCDRHPVIQERVVYVAPQGATEADNGFQYPVGLPTSYESHAQIEEKH